MSQPLSKRNLGPRLVMVGLVLVIMIMAADYVRSRWIVGGVSPNNPTSLIGHWLFVVDRHNKQVERGALVAFRTDERMTPWYSQGTIFVKQVAALPGDRVDVDEQGMHVNGRTLADALLLTSTLNKPIEAFVRSDVVHPGQYWVLGTSPDSFDSRYWGPIRQDQIVGMATVVF